MKNLRLFKKYFWKYKKKLALILVLIAAGALFESIGIGLFFPLIDFIQHGESFLHNDKFKLIFNTMSMLGIKVGIVNFILVIFFVIFCRYTIINLAVILSANTYNPLIKDIRDDGFKIIINSPMSYFHSVSSGKISSMLFNETEHVGQSINFIIQIAINLCFIAVYAINGFLISWKLVAIVGLVAIVRYKILGFCIRNVRALGKEDAQIRATINSYLTGIYQGIDIIKSYATELKEEGRFKHITSGFLRVVNWIVYNQALANFVDGVLSAGALCFVIYIAITVLNLKGSSILVFLFIINRIIPCLTIVNDARIRVAQYTSGIVYLKQIFKERSVSDIQRWGNVTKSDFTDSIAFENVSFSYTNSDLVLNHINIAIHTNEKIALIGESGSGKTTFIRLLLRLYEPTIGNIYIDGMKISDFSRDSWKSLVSVVSQDTFIFDDTIENNIKYSVEKCTDDEFWTAVKHARVGRFLDVLPQKEKTILGERGMRLSGGQRQRIAIARAFLRDAPILIFDEATSSLDSVTENQIQEAIDDLAKDRTVIIIAHRLSTVKKVDRIIVLDKGKIVESGSHEELLNKGNLYQRYYNLQIY